MDTDLLRYLYRHNPDSFEYFPLQLKNNVEFIGSLLPISCRLIIYLSEALRDHPEIFIQGTKYKSWVLHFASDRLKDNYEFVLQIMTWRGYALNSASDQLKDNETIVLTAIQQYGLSF